MLLTYQVALRQRLVSQGKEKTNWEPFASANENYSQLTPGGYPLGSTGPIRACSGSHLFRMVDFPEKGTSSEERSRRRETILTSDLSFIQGVRNVVKRRDDMTKKKKTHQELLEAVLRELEVPVYHPEGDMGLESDTGGSGGIERGYELRVDNPVEIWEQIKASGYLTPAEIRWEEVQRIRREKYERKRDSRKKKPGRKKDHWTVRKMKERRYNAREYPRKKEQYLKWQWIERDHWDRLWHSRKVKFSREELKEMIGEENYDNLPYLSVHRVVKGRMGGEWVRGNVVIYSPDGSVLYQPPAGGI